jgi:hypothetical protein
MVEFDIGFKKASAKTDIEIFTEELACDFARWRRLPSSDRQDEIYAWVKMGSLASSAFRQRIVYNYKENSLESALPVSLQSITETADFEQWRSIAVQRAMERWGPMNILERYNSKDIPRAFAERVVSRLMGVLCMQDLSIPLFSDRNGKGVYLRKMVHEKGVNFMLALSEKRVGAHNGLHGIVRNCGASKTSDLDIETVVLEIVRNVNIMFKFLPGAKAQFRSQSV